MSTTDLAVIEHPLRDVPRVSVSARASAHAGLLVSLHSVARVAQPGDLEDAQVRIIDWTELDQVVLGVPVVVVADAPLSVGDVRAALVAGAAALVDPSMPAQQVASVLAAAAAGQTTVPGHLVFGLLTRLEEPPEDLDLGLADLELLHEVAEGFTLDDLAAARGLSSRTIRRELRAVWGRLGVSCRAAGLVRAARWGLLVE